MLESLKHFQASSFRVAGGNLGFQETLTSEQIFNTHLQDQSTT